MTKAICDRIIKVCNYLAVPVATVVATLTDVDISIYCVAGLGALASVFEFVKLCLKK